MKKIILSLLILASIKSISQTQVSTKQNYKLAVVAFYNLENFYDTLDDPITSDEEFTPKGERNYNSAIYWNKVGKLASVIKKLGTDDDKYPCPDGAAFDIAVAFKPVGGAGNEIEGNRVGCPRIVEDLQLLAPGLPPN